MMTGMGFRLSDGRYADSKGQRGDSYSYPARDATIAFSEGFMDGQTGTGVGTKGFQLSSTVNCEPWR